MSKHYDNLDVLNDFVEVNDLDKSSGSATFDCIFTITTPKHQNRVETTEAMITFNGYNDEGVVSIFKSKLNRDEFPTVFKAKFNNFRLSGKHLLIDDTHPTIGKYSAIVTVI